ncbi:TPA: hypothetical protein JD310_000062 [Morganella morganii]|nr:hypothetical protein B5S45_02995 [Morganella morganii]RTY20879.1 hypothetical protein EKS23_10875 [Morganella morganii subsp. morganii]CDK66516.1 hypothetical protein [Morganella morganii IS15]HAU5614517.1 hypothetical protein [Morganella morganii]
MPVTIGFNDSRSQLINLVIPRKPAQNKSPAISRVIAGCSRQKKVRETTHKAGLLLAGVDGIG